MKKTLALLLVAVMAFQLLACGGAAVSTPSDQGTAPAATVTNDAPAAETKPAEAAAPAQNDSGLLGNNKEEVETAVETYHEAPMLAERVAKGELPPVEERIPDHDNIFVETNATGGAALEIGNYGGIMSYATTSTGSWEIARICLQRQVEFNSDGSEYFNFLKDIQVSDDFKTYTFYFREGVKWSDGVPFTTDDVLFWYYMLHQNNYDKVAYWENLYQWVDGEKVWADLKKVDDYTVTWTFAEPQFPANFYLQADFKTCWAPMHFFKDKVPSSIYNPNPYFEDTGLTDEEVLANYLRDGLEFETVAKAGDCIFKSWNYYAVPTMNAYMLTDVEGFRKYQDSTCILVRNPYFWKVDAAGNQLPYIDEIHINKVSDMDQAQLMLQSGEVDYIKNVPIDKVNAIMDAMGDKAEAHEVKSVSWGYFQIDFNITHPNEKIRALMSNIDFRRAVSVCVDRNEVVNLWYDGLALPTNFAPQYPNFGYNEEWAYQDVFCKGGFNPPQNTS